MTGREQPHGRIPAEQEGLHLGGRPDVVDHQQHPALTEDLAQLGAGGEGFGQLRHCGIEEPSGRGDGGREVGCRRVGTDGHPHDAVDEPLLHPRMVGNHAGQGRLAEPSGSQEARGQYEA